MLIIQYNYHNFIISIIVSVVLYLVLLYSTLLLPVQYSCIVTQGYVWCMCGDVVIDVHRCRITCRMACRISVASRIHASYRPAKTIER